MSSTIKLSLIAFAILAIILAAFVNSKKVGTRKPAPFKSVRANALYGRNRNRIVHQHNVYRNKVASGNVKNLPVAECMELMVWNSTLAEQALEWVKTAQVSADPKLSSYPAGQNRFILTTTNKAVFKYNLTKAVDSWFADHTNGYTGEAKAGTERFAQLIWGNSNQVGCAIHYFIRKRKFNVYLVCNYYKPGNIQGMKPYKYGKRNCRRYEMVRATKYPSLCKKAR